MSLWPCRLNDDGSHPMEVGRVTLRSMKSASRQRAHQEMRHRVYRSLATWRSIVSMKYILPGWHITWLKGNACRGRHRGKRILLVFCYVDTWVKGYR